MGICKCGAALPGRRRLCDACRAAAARRSAMRWHEKKAAGQRVAYAEAPKKCPVCGAALPWEKHGSVYCGGECAQEAKRRRSNDYNARLREQRAREKMQAAAADEQARRGDKADRKAKKAKAALCRDKALTLREAVRLLEAENAARKARGEEPLSYGRFVREKGI